MAEGATTEGREPEQSEGKTRASTKVGPRDGKRAFDRIRSVLDRLEEDVRDSVVKAVIAYGELGDVTKGDDEEED